MAGTWTCRSCGASWPRTKQRCDCGKGRRPTRRRPAHARVLDEMPYEDWVALYGEVCGICGRPPGPRRRLDRDHDHRTGAARGLLCHLCNRSLPARVDARWLRRAAAYLDQAERTARKERDRGAGGLEKPPDAA